MDSMALSNRSSIWRGPPLLLQILLLLLGGLVVAQAVTLALTLILPPAPAQQHGLDAVAAALRGQPIEEDRPDRLVRKLQNDPPDISGPSWLVSEHSQRELASLLGTDAANVRLAFYTPLPFAGTAAPRRANDDVLGLSEAVPHAPPVRLARATGRSPYLQFASYDPAQNGPRPGAPPPPGAGNGSSFGSFARPSGGGVAPWAAEQPSRNTLFGPSASERDSDKSAGPSPSAAPEKHELIGPPALDKPEAAETAPSPVMKPKSSPPARSVAPSPPVQAERKAAPVVPVRTPQRGLFGLAPAPFVEGDFVAAWRMPNGQWSIVQPAPEPFPNSWQRRVVIWFAVSFALTAPFGWLFARRIVKPLSGFVEAAELLGRDPSAVVRGLDGPAEVGRAARAFNRMQSRLKSFVDDRTAMVGAISHDLRTPLTRLRFRIEDVESEAMRDGMIGEVEEMEQMITSVLAFIRDASTPGVRERLDLRTILDEVVRNVTLIGGDAAVEMAQPAPVEVDILGIRRLLTNLVENAVKYGERARIRLRIDQDCAVAEVADDGPGVPDDELERVFEPFYRATNAAGKQGNGLGLAVCRSIARAHGGDVRLLRSDRGFIAQLRIPLYDAA
jgi:signal transduction histidine kinase